MPEYIAEAKPAIIDLDRRMFMRILVTGVIIGFLAWGLTYILQNYILQALLCHGPKQTACESSDVYAGNISAVLIAIVGISALVRFGVFRPLLIVLATVVTLWGLAGWLTNVSMIETALWTVVLYAISYVAFAWLARIRNAVVMIIIVVLIVAALRIFPMFLN